MSDVAVIITWIPADVQALHPEWDIDKCAEALHDAKSVLQDRSIELGWIVLEDLVGHGPGAE